ncbi:MAG: XRE family transcriptional regulator [Treponema sp.]|jgi:DNA-binding transcriptional regulator YiaG|nr:XRE family transcriptional regulator [Treponema sp.]
MSKKFMSEGAQVMHEMAQDLYADGIIDAARMREYDELCFADASKPETIRQPVRELKSAAALARA